MSETQETPFMDKAAAELFGAIISQNVANLAHTTDAIEGYLRDEIKLWQTRYEALYRKVDAEASKVTTRALENVLSAHSYHYSEAVRGLEKMFSDPEDDYEALEKRK